MRRRGVLSAGLGAGVAAVTAPLITACGDEDAGSGPRVAVPNRPFSTEWMTGLPLPDGIFEVTLGRQRLNAYFRSDETADINNAQVTAHSDAAGVQVSDAVVTATLPKAGCALLTWDVDLTGAQPGTHQVEFTVRSGSATTTVTKKIFVMRTTLDVGTGAFVGEVPEGKVHVQLKEAIGPKGYHNNRPPLSPGETLLTRYADLIKSKADVQPESIPLYPTHLIVTYEPAGGGYTGQYAPLPFQDPSVKTVVATVIAVILLVAAFVVAVVAGAAVTVSSGGAGGAAVVAVVWTCCSSPGFVAATVLAVAGAISGIIGGFGDQLDPFRHGQSMTSVPDQARTRSERLDAKLTWPAKLEAGKPFVVATDWQYERSIEDAHGKASTLTFRAQERLANEHLLDHCTVDAPDVVKPSIGKSEWVVRAQFWRTPTERYPANRVYAVCYLQHTTKNLSRQFALQDDGIDPGTFLGRHTFTAADAGRWKFTVAAFDVNDVPEGTDPVIAAKTIGGMPLTSQVAVTFSGGQCPYVPDGEVEVI